MSKEKKNVLSLILEKLFKLIRKAEFLEIIKAIEELEGKITREELARASGKKNGDYLVTVAARHGRVDVLKYLEDHLNASLEVANNDGKRPIHEAAQYGYVDCVSYLIRAGVDVDALKRATWTPLMLACTKDNLDVIKTLIDQGGATYNDLKNKDGWSSFHIACREGHVAILRYFLELNPNIWKTKSNMSRTPLHTASLNGKLEAVRELLLVPGRDDDDFRGDCRDVCGATPLTDAIKGGHVDIVNVLIEFQSRGGGGKLTAVLDECDSLGRRPLDIAAMFGDVDIFEVVLEATMGKGRGRTRTMTTTISTSSTITEDSPPRDSPIVSRDSPLSSRDSKYVLLRRNEDRRRICLHYAALEGQKSVVERIVNRLRSENVDLKEILGLDSDGKSPLDLASIGKRADCVAFLKTL